MPIPSRNYDEIELSDEPSFEFTLGGKEWHCKASEDIPWATVESFLAAQASGNTEAVVVMMDDLFRAVLWNEEVEDFLEMKADTAGPVTVTRFNELIGDLVKAVFGTPTSPPSSSRAGRRSTSGRGSGAGSSSKGSPARRAG